MQPTIYFASDHAGFELKNLLVSYVRDTLRYDVIDCGADVYDQNDDFTEFIATAVREISANPKTTKGIILGGSGQGEAMLANRFHNVRAVVYYGGDEEIIRLSRVHNDANVLSLGARFIDSEEAKHAVSLWLSFEHEPVDKYDRRILDIELESQDETVIPTPLLSPLAVTLAPSIPAQSFTQIESLFLSLTGVASEVQVDLVDGVFAPFVSWPFTEAGAIKELFKLQKYADVFDIEIDCMSMHPEKYLDAFVALGVSRVIVHAGTTSVFEDCIAHACANGYAIGLGILNSTPMEVLTTYAEVIDFVQVMGIEHIGQQGQPFDVRTLETVKTIRSLYPRLEIAVDGAVNKDTIPALVEAGVNRFTPGSAIVASENPSQAYRELARMVGL